MTKLSLLIQNDDLNKVREYLNNPATRIPRLSEFMREESPLHFLARIAKPNCTAMVTALFAHSLHPELGTCTK